MKLALIIVSIISLLAFILFYSTTDDPSDIPVDMPWHVTVLDPNHSEVFGIVLNKTSLERARQQFRQLDGIALYQNKQGRFSLEAYFGKVFIGPFSARLIANLDAPQSELEMLVEHSIKRVLTEDGSSKWTLNQQKQIEQGLRKISSLTYIPGYSGMDQDFIQQHFGEPDDRKQIDDNTVLWFYPDLGVRIMIDNEGKELFEYSSPAQFDQLLGDS